jgi:hypothetical protein
MRDSEAMKPFATLGSEISKVRERVRRSAESLRPAKVASDVRDQRDRLLAKLGEQTFRLIAERKLVVPKMLQESVERLASLLGGRSIRARTRNRRRRRNHRLFVTRTRTRIGAQRITRRARAQHTRWTKASVR